MRYLLVAAAALLPFHPVLAQEANQNEMQAVTEIARCMAQGLPDNWVSAQMVVELARPGESTGAVRYLFARNSARLVVERSGNFRLNYDFPK